MRVTKHKILLFVGISFILFAITTIRGQKIDNKVITWEDKLYEKAVDYSSFACEDTETNKKIVSEFFKVHPLKRVFPVCHNNCAILESFPRTPLPPYDNKIKGNGFIAIHVLVNEKGEPVFARSLNGHPLMRSILQQRACRAEFRSTDEKRQNVIKFCVGDECKDPQPVQ